MLIHELTLAPKKINEDLKSFFGLNNPQVAAAWDQIGGQVIQDLSARFSKDPRYANMPLAQRKDAIVRDQGIQQQALKYLDNWNQTIAALQTKSATPLTDDQYKAAFLNWANKTLFNNKFSALDANIQTQTREYFDQFVAHRGDTDTRRRNALQQAILSNLLADETARMVQVATDLSKAQAAMTTPQTAPTTQTAPTVGGAPKPGLPGAAEIAKLDALIANAARAQT